MRSQLTKYEREAPVDAKLKVQAKINGQNMSRNGVNRLLFLKAAGEKLDESSKKLGNRLKERGRFTKCL